MPELEIPDGGIAESAPNNPAAHFADRRKQTDQVVSMLGVQVSRVLELFPLIPGMQADPVDAVQAGWIQVGQFELPPAVSGQHDVGVQMADPAVGCELGNSQADAAALVEGLPVAAEFFRRQRL